VTVKASGIEIVGDKEVQRILDEIAPNHARNLMRATIHGVASIIAKDAKANAPKDTGNLKRNIKAKRKKSPPDSPVSEVHIKSDGFYWRFIEYGTSGKTSQPERPFVRPAIDRARSNLSAIIREQFGQKLEKALARQAKKDAKK
jgi:HK97 gp10 family phage protein